MAKKKLNSSSKKKVIKKERLEAEHPTALNSHFHQIVSQASKDHLIQVNVALAAEEYACIFGANKNLYRVTPSMQDGLRPGKRRMLYTWWARNGKPMDTRPETLTKLRNSKSKVGKIQSATMDIHPHGDTAIYETIVNEGQIFRNNVLLIDKQGNFGNLNGDPASASRYIEMGMSEYMIDCFFDDFEHYCIPMKETYDGKSLEPEYLPAKYPHALFNPQFSGIGYGFASNIPPFNVQEVMEAVIKLIKDPNASIFLVPDFAFGVDIIDNGELKKINKTGEGKLMVQARYTIDALHNIITIHSMPLNMYAKPWIEKLVPMCQKGGIFEGQIKEIKNNTHENTLEISLILSPTAKADDVMDLLLKKTNLRYTHSVNMAMIDDYDDYQYGVKSYLKAWIEFRRNSLRYMFNNKLVRVAEKKHINDILLKIFDEDHIQETLEIARKAKSRSDNIEMLMKRYGMTSVQAGAIVDLKIYQFNKDSYSRFKEDKKKLKAEIDRIEKLITYDEEIDKLIIEQMEEGIKKYGRPRRSRILKLDSLESDVPETKELIGVSKNGYIKKVNAEKYDGIGTVGKELRDYTVFTAGSRDSILVISSDGTISKIGVSGIPDMKPKDIGVEIARYFDGHGDIITVLRCPSEKEQLVMEDFDLLMITRCGYAKRTRFSEFLLKDGKSKSLLTLNKGDALAEVLMVSDDSLDVVICTTKGNGIRIPIQSIRQISKGGKGQRVIEIAEKEEVQGICTIDPSVKHILYITTSGKMKLTELRYFPRLEKGKSPINLITLDTTDQLLGVASVKKHDQVKLFGRKGEKNYEPIEVSLIPIRSRVSKGERIVKTLRGDNIVGFKVFRA